MEERISLGMYGSSPRLRVRAVATKRDTFVALPPLLADQCRQVASAGPLPIELVEISPPCKRHVFAFVGQQVSEKPYRAGQGESPRRDSGSHADCVEVSATYADYLGLRDGAVVRVHVRADVPQATKVTLSPDTEADYAALSISSQAAEQGDVLNQVRSTDSTHPPPRQLLLARSPRRAAILTEETEMGICVLARSLVPRWRW